MTSEHTQSRQVRHVSNHEVPDRAALAFETALATEHVMKTRPFMRLLRLRAVPASMIQIESNVLIFLPWAIAQPTSEI